jgi:adenylate kinase family enzyme
MRLGNRVHRRYELYRPIGVADSAGAAAVRRAPARFAVLGNSGSGKSTLTAWLSRTTGAAALDLDVVAWEPGKIAVPRPPELAAADVRAFCAGHASFVVEGCYAALVGAALDGDTTLVYMDPGVEACLAFCRARPFEPHKYASAAEQDERLAFLLAWVRGYDARDDDLSRRAHERLFADYAGPKFRWTSPLSFAPLDARLESLLGPGAAGR